MLNTIESIHETKGQCGGMGPKCFQNLILVHLVFNGSLFHFKIKMVMECELLMKCRDYEVLLSKNLNIKA